MDVTKKSDYKVGDEVVVINMDDGDGYYQNAKQYIGKVGKIVSISSYEAPFNIQLDIPVSNVESLYVAPYEITKVTKLHKALM